MTSNTEEQSKTEAGASARAPEVPTKANVAPRKPRVAPSKPKSGNKATSRKAGTKGAKRAKVPTKATGAPPGEQDRKGTRPPETPGRSHYEGTHESDRLATAFGPGLLIGNRGQEDGPDGYFHQGRGTGAQHSALDTKTKWNSWSGSPFESVDRPRAAGAEKWLPGCRRTYGVRRTKRCASQYSERWVGHPFSNQLPAKCGCAPFM